ncbi:MAG TPA: hypothetical protein VEI50_11690 [Nitrospiraceae bacterium]|nr:hypothetical protein [Nitrospiraceae bacterium]
MMSKSVLQVMFVLLVLGMIPRVVQAQQPTLPAFEDRTHDDHFTFKYGKPYTLDPYTWVYTKEFAQMFRMPDKWIDANLKGALAIAFRMTTIGITTCGLGGREDSCWPPVQCQLDVYYDNRIKLPWMHDEIMRDFLLRGVSSHEFLQDLNHSKGFHRYRPKDGKGVPRVLATEASLRVGKYSSGFAPIAYFDREYEPGVGLIGWVGIGVCPTPIGMGQIAFFDVETQDKINHMQVKREDAKPIHVIELPESFMRRANIVYERDNKPNVAVTERLKQQLLQSR